MLLSGVKIVSFCHFLQGPAAAQYLADMGGDVIKVEPVGGAHERRWSGADVYVEGVSGFFLCANRNKRSIAIDLKSEEGKEVARRLIAQADVVMENFRPGVFARLGFDEATLRELNPSLIFASASGFGSSGPMAQMPGQDILIQARSGLVSVTGTPENGPTVIGATVVDQHGGALMAMGILGAIIRRMREGKGTRVEASLMNAGLDLQGEALVNYFAGNMTRNILTREENLATWFHAAPYGCYPVKDGHVIVSLCDEAALAEAMDSDDLRAMIGCDRFAERDAYAKALRAATIRFDRAEIAARLDAKGIWWSPVNYYDDLLEDPQLEHGNVFCDVDVRGTVVRLLNHPNRYDGHVPEVHTIALEIGQHTRAILSEIGYSTEEVEWLVDRRVVDCPKDDGATTKNAS